jgi:hypothetical protein
VIGGFDFVGDAYDGELKGFYLPFILMLLKGTNKPFSDDDPLDKCFGKFHCLQFDELKLNCPQVMEHTSL